MGSIGFIVAAAVATYAIRLAGFGLGGRAIPPPFERFLAYVPVAAFAALIAPDLGLGDPQWAARGLGIIASALVAWRTRQLWAGLGAGMAVFWLVKLLI
jgi:branched-subunit amino acid transport protein